MLSGVLWLLNLSFQPWNLVPKVRAVAFVFCRYVVANRSQ